MEARTALIRSIALAAVVFAAQIPVDVPRMAPPEGVPVERPVAEPSGSTVADRSVAEGTPPATSLDPSVMVGNATPTQQERLDLALRRFADTGLVLPDLEVVFDPTGDECNGGSGLFRWGVTPWRIAICEPYDAVFEHELAHAWEAAALTDEDRDRYMALRGFTVWNDQSVPWGERAAEDVAVTIQRALSGISLPEELSTGQAERLLAFEFLTGMPDPRFAEWWATHGAVGIAVLSGRSGSNLFTTIRH